MIDKYPPGLPDDSWMTTFAENRLGVFLEATRMYGDLVHFWVGKKRHLYLVSQPEYIRYVLVEHPEQFGRGTMFKRRASRVVGTGLITSEGEFNKRQRRLMLPAFHHQRIGAYTDIMIQETLRMLQSWQVGQQRNVHHDMMRVTMNIVTRTLFGADVFDATSFLGEAITASIEYLNDEALLEPKNAIEQLDATISNIIAQRREMMVDQGDLLSMLLMAQDEDGSSMTDKQIRDEAMTLFLAGHETSANTLTWAWYLLSKNPVIEAKLVEELDRVLGGRTPTIHDLPRLSYTEKVIKEVLRLYPPAWNLTREVLEDVQFGDFTIPKGSTIVISPFIVQRNARYWDDPERFEPERFAEGWEKRMQRGIYFPFSYGPRVCLGQAFATTELQLLLATIAQRYRLSLLPEHTVEIEPFIALRPKGGLPVTIQARESVTLSTTD